MTPRRLPGPREGFGADQISVFCLAGSLEEFHE